MNIAVPEVEVLSCSLVEGQTPGSITSGPDDDNQWMTDVFGALYAVCAKTKFVGREHNKSESKTLRNMCIIDRVREV